ncbi:MAG: peptide ABC transporter substrate-binding protein [Deltaproteobacteria bacterium]|nr:peptide ABC transporter substrate-binding protein [Deltaproteobacteria bacterium]
MAKMSLLLCLLLFACTSLTSQNFPSLNISVASEPPTLDWNLATDNVSYQILNQLMEGLTAFDENLKPTPAIAQSWKISPDGKIYTFYLNPNYRWSDGKPVTAHDFVYSWTRLLDPKTAAEYAYYLFDVEGAQEFNQDKLKDATQLGFKALNAHTLEVRLHKPIVFFPSLTTFMVTFPLRQDIVEQHGSHWTDPKNIQTCGPYQLQEWWHQYRLQLKTNPHYGGLPKPKIEKLRIYVVQDPSTTLALYESGQLDIALLPPIALSQYRHHPELISQTKLRGYYLGFNIRKSPVHDVRIRRALSMALDKSPLPQILKGGEQITSAWIPPGLLGYEENAGIRFDPEQAKALLAEASSKSLPPLTLVFNSDPLNKKIAEWAQAQWKKHLNLNVELENQEWKSYLAQLAQDPPALFRLGWGADYPDPDNFMNLFTQYSGNNHTGWKNPQYDTLIAQAAVEKDVQKRIQAYHQAQKLLLEDQTVIIPLFIATQNILVKKSVRNFKPLPLDFVYYKLVSKDN